MKRLLIFYLFILKLTLASTELHTQINSSNEEEFITYLQSRGDWDRLGKQSISAGILALATLGVYIVNDDKENHLAFADVGKEWKNNIGKGTTWDRSSNFINFVAHPYAGASYYTAARKSDFNRFDSFLYSLTMSTFLWEYGLEAVKEPPSIQDLVITPFIGSFLGEFFYYQGEKILENNGKLFDSRILGTTALVVLDPIGSLANFIGFKDEDFFGNWNILLNEETGSFSGLSISISGSI